jgi:heme exporter protein C
MRSSWWKVLCVILLSFTVIGGILMPAPRLHILNETIRNLYFHVPMWFTMMALFTAGVIYSIKFLRSNNLVHDIYAVGFTNTGIAFSIYGMATGMEWANYTWGSPWSNDPKELGTALCMLTYFAYAILRNGMKDEEKRAKISAVYNVFAYALIIPLIGILPRMVDSLHPGNGGNPAFKQYDRDTNMNMVFYSAGIGWILLGFWIATLKIRTGLIAHRRDNDSNKFDFEKNSSNA